VVAAIATIAGFGWMLRVFLAPPVNGWGAVVFAVPLAAFIAAWMFFGLVLLGAAIWELLIWLGKVQLDAARWWRERRDAKRPRQPEG
jgi:hypothetical protein